MITSNCPCGRNKSIQECCIPIIEGKNEPVTAEDLMRSRYTAFTLANGAYLLKSHHSKTRKPNEKKAIESWAKSVTWIKLEVISTSQGQANDTIGKVEFKAFFLENGKIDSIHENSLFQRENDKWVYYGME